MTDINTEFATNDSSQQDWTWITIKTREKLARNVKIVTVQKAVDVREHQMADEVAGHYLFNP